MKENILIPETFAKVTHTDASWSLLSCENQDEKKKIQNKYYHNDLYDEQLSEKYRIIEENEQRYEGFYLSMRRGPCWRQW